MKYFLVIVAFAMYLSGCGSNPNLVAHLEAEQDFARQQYHSGPVEQKYDPEYIDDCLFYQDLVCEFE